MSEPLWLELARKELGTKELPGRASNPNVERYYYDAVGHRATDDVPWCAAFVGAMLKRAGIRPSGLLTAISYLKWGISLNKPQVGAVVVMPHHVGFYLGDAGDRVEVLGGNQSDAVTISRYAKDRILGYRWPAGDRR